MEGTLIKALIEIAEMVEGYQGEGKLEDVFKG
jgi:hypothetical protein